MYINTGSYNMSALQIGTIDFQYNTPSQFMNFPTGYEASIT